MCEIILCVNSFKRSADFANTVPVSDLLGAEMYLVPCLCFSFPPISWLLHQRVVQCSIFSLSEAGLFLFFVYLVLF